MSERPNDDAYAYSGPCMRCGHLPDEHGENYACTRWDRGGDHYTPGTTSDPLSRVQAVEAAEDRAEQVAFDSWRERGL